MNAHEWAKDADILLADKPHKPKERQKILAEYFEEAFREGEKEAAHSANKRVDLAGLCATAVAAVRRGETDDQIKRRMVDAMAFNESLQP